MFYVLGLNAVRTGRRPMRERSTYQAVITPSPDSWSSSAVIKTRLLDLSLPKKYLLQSWRRRREKQPYKRRPYPTVRERKEYPRDPKQILDHNLHGIMAFHRDLKVRSNRDINLHLKPNFGLGPRPRQKGKRESKQLRHQLLPPSTIAPRSLPRPTLKTPHLYYKNDRLRLQRHLWLLVSGHL